MHLVDSSYATRVSDNALVDELAAEIVGLAGRLAAGSCRWLLLVADFDTRGGYLRFGLASTVQWLSYACGIAHRTAVDQLRVAHALAAHPALAAQMAAGRISYSQARAIARIATPGETQLVADLIDAARHGTVAHLEALVRGLRTVEHHEHNEQLDRPGEPAGREHVTQGWTADSRWRLSARLQPERAALVAAALDTLARTEGLSPADALVRLAEIGLATLADTTPPRELRGDERAAVVIHLHTARLPAAAAPTGCADPADPANPAGPGQTPVARSAEPARPYAHLADGPGLPDAVVQRLLCAGRVRTVLHDERGSVLDVGRAHRLVTDRQYRALLIRHHGHCAHPGCPNSKTLHAHHRRHWLHGGRTDMTNLILLCERHHLAHHDGDYTITTTPDGEYRFLYADGPELPPHPTPTAAHNPIAHDPIDHPDIAPDAATTHWDGQRLDHHYAIAVLADRRKLAVR